MSLLGNLETIHTQDIVSEGIRMFEDREGAPAKEVAKQDEEWITYCSPLGEVYGDLRTFLENYDSEMPPQRIKDIMTGVALAYGGLAKHAREEEEWANEAA